MKYIKLEDAAKAVNIPNLHGGIINALQSILIDYVPYIEIVHCNECKYCLRADSHELWCRGHGCPAHLTAENDFCSKGRRKGEE